VRLVPFRDPLEYPIAGEARRPPSRLESLNRADTISSQPVDRDKPAKDSAKRNRGRSLRVELVATLAMVLMMAVVTFSLGAELLGQRRHNTQETQRL
jgi:hypothetical protein